MKRNLGIDIFHVVLIYGIVVYHAFFTGNYASGLESRMWTWCVPGFAFISGFFGVRFRLSKIIHLWVVASLCFIPVLLIGGRFLQLIVQAWYLHAYTILLLLSPIINGAIENYSKDGKHLDLRLCLVGVLILGVWSWLSELAYCRIIIPRPRGLGALSFVTILVLYILGRSYRLNPEKFTIFDRGRVYWFLSSVLLLPFLGHYTSPVVIILVVIMFKFFERIEIKAKKGKYLRYFVGSGFTIYLLHANWQVLPRLNELSCYLIEALHFPRYIGLLFSSAIVFLFCFIIYMLGIFIFYPLSVPYKKLLAWVDNRFQKFLNEKSL